MNVKVPSITVAIITKNEAKNLKNCLRSIYKWVDEIVILDGDSTDDTKKIAKQYTNNFFIDETWQGFGKQRQKLQTYIKTDFVLWIDADERISEELQKSILKAISNHKANTIYKINRLNNLFGSFIYHSSLHPDWITRLYKTKEAQYSDALVHESVIEKGKSIQKLDGYLYHYTHEDIHHYINKTTKYLKLWADERKGKKSSLFKALLHALGSFIKMYILKCGFLDGKVGFILAFLTMNTTFIKYIDLYLRNKK